MRFPVSCVGVYTCADDTGGPLSIAGTCPTYSGAVMVVVRLAGLVDVTIGPTGVPGGAEYETTVLGAVVTPVCTKLI